MKLLAIDGNSILNRAFYGIRLLSNSKGVFTNAITGFLNIFLKELSEVSPDCAAVAFDMRAPTFRHKKSAAYKANRKGMPEELAMQLPIIKQILTAMGIKVIECEGFEADDILGTLSRLCTENGGECYIVTGDRDSLQLVSESTTVRLATNKGTVIYDPAKVKEVYGLEPLQLIEVKALQGDSSDNISGVAGIGEKTALSLIQQFGSVDSLYENLDGSTLTASVKAKLANGKDSAYESRWLGTIVKDAPIPQDMSEYAKRPQDNAALCDIFGELEMFKMRERFASSEAQDIADTAPEEKTKLSNAPKYDVKPLDGETVRALGGIVYFIYADGNCRVFSGGTIYETNDEQTVLELLECDCEKKCFACKIISSFFV